MKGSCLCGNVVYEIVPPFKLFQYCHCSRCRKFTGSAHAANIFVAPSQFRWLTGEAYVGRFEHPQAKYFATSFCKHCGSSLPWETQGKKNVIVPAGTLDENPGIQPQQNICWDSKADWFCSPSDLPAHESTPKK